MLLVLLFSLLCIAYTYVGYPAILSILAWRARRDASDEIGRFGDAVPTGFSAAAPAPFVSVVVAAHNEADSIGKRIENLLSQNYPADRIEIIVGSDGSTDGTVEVAARIGDTRVRILGLPRQGRAGVHNACVAAARGQIVVFTDAGTTFDSECVAQLVAPFRDPTVGCTSGKLTYTNTGQPGIPQSAGWYWRYEIILRRLETAWGSMVASTGACMAMRAGLFRPLMPTDDIDDAAPVDVALLGGRVLFVPTALAYDQAPASSADELAARRRIVTKNLQAIVNRPDILSWRRHPKTAWQLLSHRVLRYLTPVFLALLFISNLVLREEGAFAFLWKLQVLFYGGAALGFLADRLHWRVPIVTPLFAFCLANAGFLLGVWNIVRGRGVTVYKPIR